MEVIMKLKALTLILLSITTFIWAYMAYTRGDDFYIGAMVSYAILTFIVLVAKVPEEKVDEIEEINKHLISDE